MLVTADRFLDSTVGELVRLYEVVDFFNVQVESSPIQNEPEIRNS